MKDNEVMMEVIAMKLCYNTLSKHEMKALSVTDVESLIHRELFRPKTMIAWGLSRLSSRQWTMGLAVATVLGHLARSGAQLSERRCRIARA